MPKTEPEIQIELDLDANPAIRQDEPMHTYSVRLTSWHVRQARKMGDSNLSRGIRRAIERISLAKAKDR